MDMYEANDFQFAKVDGGVNFNFSTILNLITKLHPEMPRSDKKKAAHRLIDEETQADYFVSSMFQVAKRLLPPDQHGFGVNTPTYLSIKRLDREPINDWRAMQKIKNAIVGKEWEAVEIYPAESRLVDTANQYHLFCWDAPFPIYVFNHREVLNSEEAEVLGQKLGVTTKQRMEAGKR
tara:strand:+ start:3516 stop:4049 length:534 start_codon:yes stop_codon:yes gene_type:complete